MKLYTDITQLISLGMGEGTVAESPAIITSPGLGSCVALILYDKEKKVGGMAHVMLPDSKAVVHRLTPPPSYLPPQGGEDFGRNLPQGEGRCIYIPPPLRGGGQGEGEQRIFSPFWFADTAISYLLSDILKRGGCMENIFAKAAGGACMFPVYDGESKGIGEQNIESIKGLLKAFHIHLAGWDLGGNYGRSAELYLETGRVLIKAVGREDREI